MAESTKRQNNAAGKAPVATPNVGQLVALETAMSGAIGGKVRVQTTVSAHPTLEGTLYTICPLTHIVALSTTPPNTIHHLLSLPSITTLTILSPPPSVPALPPYLSTTALHARAAAALQRAHEKASRVNRNVSKEAQEIFDAISRMLPTRWDGKDIVVMDQVVVKGPGYRSEDCRAGKEAGSALARVKKVLENERKKLAQREPKVPKPVIPAVPAIPTFSGGPRKGG
ncbi:hypothetical protein HO173_008780 [Letharia columbiana]|uniref:AD domain-containing protein n=1 Tax=Letharia columbiana TaxID=112416 RepID=A0A8H6FQV9_9LECA|nr:uncharacterized protein HO173_008780 [Letharia columbiana]KAF6233024.1 hypothetical protein HO173_008780 [Letharia columbiana]